MTYDDCDKFGHVPDICACMYGDLKAGRAELGRVLLSIEWSRPCETRHYVGPLDYWTSCPSCEGLKPRSWSKCKMNREDGPTITRPKRRPSTPLVGACELCLARTRG